MTEWNKIMNNALIPIKNALNKSFKNHSNEYEEWQYSIFLFQNIFGCIHENYKENETESITSLVYHRIPIWQRSIYWSSIAAYAGVYEVVAWAMRSMLEDITQAIYLDEQLCEAIIDVKLKKLSELRDNHWGFGKFRKNIKLPHFLNAKMIALYKYLNEYVHPSRELIEKEVRTRRILVEYVPQEFIVSSKMHIQTCDVVMALVIYRFPKIVHCYPRHNVTHEDYIRDLRERGFICTARILTGQNDI